MEYFSLEEEDDYNNIFITQTPKVKEVSGDVVYEDNGDLVDIGIDKSSIEMGEVIEESDHRRPQYSNISDDEMPLSGQVNVGEPNSE